LLPDDSNDSSDDEAQYVKLRHEALAVMQNIPGVVQKAVEMSLENACASAVASLMTKGVGPTAKDAKLWAKWIISVCVLSSNAPCCISFFSVPFLFLLTLRIL